MSAPVRLLLAILLAVPMLAAAAAPLRVVLDQNYPPFAIRNSSGELEGYSVDMWRLWQQKTGVPVELHGVDWPEVQPTLERGKADVIDTIFLTDARRARFDFSRPYAMVHLVRDTGRDDGGAGHVDEKTVAFARIGQDGEQGTQ